VKSLAKVWFLVALIIGVVQTGFSRGDKIIPQVADGPGWVTKFDITNVSSAQAIIGSMRLSFYKADGTKWNLQTNRGTGSDFILSLAARQTIRIETLGTSSQVTSGYAVIYDEESDNSPYSEDYVLGISVFYVFSTNSGPADTVTVTVPTPTAIASLPLQMDDANGIYSGLAFVNWLKSSPDATPSTNNVSITLYSENGIQYGTTKTITLGAITGKQEWSGYLDNADLFPGLKSFKGMAEIICDGPIGLLGLLQTRAADGTPQYSTLAAVDKETLRRNTYMIVIQASTDSNPRMPVDIDNFAVDYYRKDDGTEAYPWDLEYRYGGSNRTNRYLKPDNGAALAYIGNKDDSSFDAISLPYIKTLTYSTSTLDLSGSNLFTGYTFAIRTDIGNYAKVRIVRVVDTTDDTSIPGSVFYNKDLVLEICIYK